MAVGLGGHDHRLWFGLIKHLYVVGVELYARGNLCFGLLDQSGMRVGGQLTVQFLNTSDKFESATSSDTFTESGPAFQPEIAAKIPVGGGGVVSAGLYYLIRNTNTKDDPGGGSPTTSGTREVGQFGVLGGFSFFF